MKSQRIAILGTGGHGKVAYDILESSGNMVVGFIDERAKKEPRELFGLPVHPSLNYAFSADSSFKADGIFIAIGNAKLRKLAFQRADSEGIAILSAIHSTACIARKTVLERGVFLGPMSFVGINTSCGEGSIINTSASVDHDCWLGAFSHIGPGVHLSGNVTVGCGAFLGTGCATVQGVEVGDWSIVGAGSVVTKDIPSFSVAFGNPAKVRRKIPKE